MGRILIIGIPRSGTSWTADVLALARGAQFVPEPDNPPVNPPAAPIVRARGLFPVVSVGDAAPDYRTVWDHAFAGGWPNVALTRATGRALRRGLPPRALELLLRGMAPATTRIRPRPQHVVIKTVYAAFSCEWLADVYHPKVVQIERDPLNVVASWVDLNVPFGDFDRSPAIRSLSIAADLPAPTPDAPHHQRVAWCVGYLGTVMDRTALKHPDWLRIHHADLIASPQDRFMTLFRDLGLEWTSAVEAHLVSSNRPGTGYVRHRVRSELPDAWRKRLTSTQVEEIQGVLAEFPRPPAATTGQ